MTDKSSVHLYALCWNEERMLPYFFRHYDRFVSRYFIFDNASTDRSVELLKANWKVVLRPFDIRGDSFVFSALHFYNNAWKESRGQAAWVIVCNVDEHFADKDPAARLQKLSSRGVTLVHCNGYEMVSESFPGSNQRLVDTVQTGQRSEMLDKTMIFNPDAIEEISYRPGRHSCEPEGTLSWWRGGLLLHYKYLGLPYLIERSAALAGQLKPHDIADGLGAHYRISETEMAAAFDGVRNSAIKLDL